VNKRDVLEVAVKMMGLYCLISFLGSIVPVGIAVSSPDPKIVENKAVYVWFTCLGALLYLVFAILLLGRGRWIAERLIKDSIPDRLEVRSVPPPHACLDFWVRILGLYFFLSVVGRLVTHIAETGFTVRGIFRWSRLVGDGVELCLALVFILRNDYVASLVEKLSPRVDGTSPS